MAATEDHGDHGRSLLRRTADIDALHAFALALDGAEDPVVVALADDERRLLLAGAREWGGSAHPTEAVAAALGFADRADLGLQLGRIHDLLVAGAPLDRRDWRQVLVATEVAFVSDRFGSGREWPTVTGFDDGWTQVALAALRVRLEPLVGPIPEVRLGNRFEPPAPIEDRLTGEGWSS